MDMMELNSRKADFEWATRFNRILLNVIGIWPSAHKNVYNKFLSNVHVTFTFTIVVFIIVIPLTHSLVRTWGDLMSMIDNLQFTLPVIMSIIKLIVIWWKKADLLIVINMMADDWLKIKTEKERCNMLKQAQNARILTMAGFSIMILGVLFLVVLPCFGKSVRYITNITDPVKILPLPTHYIYDKNRSPYFEFTYVAQSIASLMSATCYSGVDNLLGLLIFHMCGQLENLKEKLINIQQFVDYNEGVVFVVKEHLFKEGRKMSALRLLYLISILINVAGHTCLFCAVGEILIAKCEAIYHAAYQHEWYKIQSQKAKTTVLILIRASKPLYITAGKIFPMTMSMFCNLIKTSAGYISVLLAMQN